jgi:curved DNA-binding protein CbpA
MTQTLTDPYATLGIPRDATERQVREAYRRLAMRYHPDRHPDEQTSERMRGVNEAWRILSSPIRRRRYDAGTTHEGRSYQATYPRATHYPAGRYAATPPARPTRDQGDGPGLAGALGIVAVAWLVFGSIFLGFLPAPFIGLALFAAARLVLGGILKR